ncbi:uncharacterized protein PHALS_08873 [Plasmopara halstedii]|uniref:Uncharacterized protein n=1 Tax=Plasmopara halstedii TaxID=4781 RepID=A0A0P1AEK6_PLAHL|nr:uncharacterized protein PHALS_08873 [Plasmopara halstedii]CEG38822.1 hypothetical protein PHALS_08873 [Plasmopara halstedii]|eukprot:XP_024575191.1 hypothetical protein PHALS_08873 [Plasmopara halstedii]
MQCARPSEGSVVHKGTKRHISSQHSFEAGTKDSEFICDLGTKKHPIANVLRITRNGNGPVDECTDEASLQEV